jgi:hypothetical protein
LAVAVLVGLDSNLVVQEAVLVAMCMNHLQYYPLKL